jgi:glycosyltransferase involved in cell wall biosynthesis
MTHAIACSRLVAGRVFGKGWEDRPDRLVVYCGLDFSAFAEPLVPGSARRALGIPENLPVLGHVGGFRRGKNQHHVLAVGRALLDQGHPVHLLFVGDGPLRASAEKHSRKLGIASACTFAGDRDDVPRLMRDAMDLMLFPSVHEGLGLAVVEAQAAALPCLCSDAIPGEAVLVPSLVQRMPLSAGIDRWADCARRLIQRGRAVSRPEAYAAAENSPFSVHAALARLTAIYGGNG